MPRRGQPHSDAAKARSSRSLRELGALRLDDLQPLIDAGEPLRAWQYAQAVGVSDQVAHKRLVALVEDGYATRYRSRVAGPQYLYMPVVQEDAA